MRIFNKESLLKLDNKYSDIYNFLVKNRRHMYEQDPGKLFQSG